MLKGRAWVFGDNVDTDVIIPARYLNTTDPEELAKHCMEDADPDFPKKVQRGDIIVAGKNFGCGSSREHAPIAIKASGVSCVIAESFARIFYRNAFNTGLLIIECPEAVKEIQTGDLLEVDIEKGEIRHLSKNKIFQFKPIPQFMRQILEDGGLIPHIMKKFQASCAIEKGLK
ncbi:MAG: 3-isopropylmalate dehydratase small subunit [Caldimicrobium sp.]|nr:3-isopropylmalate dehydratase small subunit [Caldimicrobium sp.]MCX7873875.1 3-isopropylmalate dehydratase small subunit [Caldimicrobium sp.]MDW8094752.1 3-isopropylmalate dehydratase small subunit [Caldimicrobium sp.]